MVLIQISMSLWSFLSSSRCVNYKLITRIVPQQVVANLLLSLVCFEQFSPDKVEHAFTSHTKKTKQKVFLEIAPDHITPSLNLVCLSFGTVE